VQRGNTVERTVLRKRGQIKYCSVFIHPTTEVVRQMVNVVLTLVACVYGPASYWRAVGMTGYCSCHMLLDKELFVVTICWASRIESSVKRLELCD
jgi:hypothetical protein